MNVSDVKRLLFSLASEHFTDASIMYAKQNFATKPEQPLVVISTGNVSRHLNPPVIVDEEGRMKTYYPMTLKVQIDLFSNGREIEVAKGVLPIRENTAEDEMNLFLNYLNSEYVKQICDMKDVSIIVPDVCTDMTGLVNDVSYEFRAMAEIDVYYTMVAYNMNGQSTIGNEDYFVKALIESEQ